MAAAQAIDSRTTLIVLVGGEAGLRCGEMMRSSGETSISPAGEWWWNESVSGNFAAA